MISVDEARDLVRERVRPVSVTEEVALERALGRVLAEPVRADRDDPPFDRSMMDGYAVRAGSGPRLEVTGSIAAGEAALPEVAPGCAVWINTGAPLPPGADAVVPVERTRGEVELLEEVAAGDNVLPRGTLAAAGDVVAEGVLTAERVGVCAAAGADPVTVLRRPRVAILATGTELKEAPGAHEIRNSNGPMLRALMAGHDVIDLGASVDDEAELDAAIARGLEADVCVTTGGVSRGDRDLVRPALEARGVEIVFHGVALQPGKPALFGAHAGGVVFGLPGNPASALVCADLFVLPFLAARAGRTDQALRETTGRLEAAVQASPDRRRVFPCRRRGDRVEPLPWRSSADLLTLTRANGYLVVEAGCDLQAGTEVACLVPERLL